MFVTDEGALDQEAPGALRILPAVSHSAGLFARQGFDSLRPTRPEGCHIGHQAAKRCPPAPVTHAAKAKERREIFDASQARFVAVPVYWRGELNPGEIVEGPAVIAEDETSTFITGTFTAHINGLGYITLSRRCAAASAKEVA